MIEENVLEWIDFFYFRVENIILGYGLKCFIGEKNELKTHFCLEGEICVTHVNSKYKNWFCFLY